MRPSRNRRTLLLSVCGVPLEGSERLLRPLWSDLFLSVRDVFQAAAAPPGRAFDWGGALELVSAQQQRGGMDEGALLAICNLLRDARAAHDDSEQMLRVLATSASCLASLNRRCAVGRGQVFFMARLLWMRLQIEEGAEKKAPDVRMSDSFAWNRAFLKRFFQSVPLCCESGVERSLALAIVGVHRPYLLVYACQIVSLSACPTVAKHRRTILFLAKTVFGRWSPERKRLLCRVMKANFLPNNTL